jgi:hypothetical protein
MLSKALVHGVPTALTEGMAVVSEKERLVGGADIPGSTFPEIAADRLGRSLVERDLARAGRGLGRVLADSDVSLEVVPDVGSVTSRRRKSRVSLERMPVPSCSQWIADSNSAFGSVAMTRSIMSTSSGVYAGRLVLGTDGTSIARSVGMPPGPKKMLSAASQVESALSAIAALCAAWTWPLRA